MSWFHRSDGEEPWRKLIKDRKPIEAVDEDSGEVIEIKPEQDRPNDIDGLLISFNYVDNAGQSTTRTVLCYHCWHANDLTYVQGFCTMRQALRTFRTDRMSNLREVRTGRDIKDPTAYFDHFTDVPPTRWQSQATSRTIMPSIPWAPVTEADREADAWHWQRHYQARRICIDGLRILGYVALSHGVRSMAERNIQESYIESRLAMTGFEQASDVTKAMMDIAAGLAVPFSSFIRSVNLIAPDHDHFELVRNCVVEMIAADGAQDPIRDEAYHRLMAAGLAAGNRR